MEEIVTTVAAEAAEPLLAWVRRQCGYVIFTNSYVGQLKDELEKLDNLRQRVQHSVDEALKDMKLIEDDVKKWAKDTETVANEARGVLENDGRAEKTGFCGWLPNPKARHCLGRDARKTAQAIQALIPQGKFERVWYEGPPPGHVPGAPNVNLSAGDGGDIITDSRASIFQGIMKALGDEKLKVIGVYGPGGVGKTTLLEEVEKKVRKEGRPFPMIVKAKVSQTPDLNDIQYQIADALSLNLKDKQSQQGRRDLLFQRLQSDPNEKVLIILDDLWEKLDLKAVGIPSGDESVKCKLLLTSRDKSVLEQKMRADRTFHLRGLSDEEAFSLFARTVGDKLKDDKELKAKAAQVVNKLAGLPLLITSVASTLKCSNVSAWENALIKVEDTNIEKIVKWSYDHLQSEDAKCLFLLCGLIGGTIKVELLLGLGMGLGLFEGFNNTIQDSRNRLKNTLDSLHSFCLLQDDGDGEETVTIHDLYSEVVVSDAFSGQNSLVINNNCGSWPKEKLEKCWACLVNVDSDRLAELMLRRFPHVKILMLSKQYDREDCSRMDFTCMEELRALYLYSMHNISLPSSIEILRNLRSLSINCHVKNVAILGKLKALWILSFAGCSIYKLPKEIGELTNLRSLNLSHCNSLEIIEPGALKGLINLEELHMKRRFDPWADDHKILSNSCGVRLAELESLTKLASLEISIHHSIILLEDGDLPFGNLVRFWINIGHVMGREFKVLRTMKLNLEGCNSILSRKWVQKTLQKTQYLHLCKLSEFKESAHELCTHGFREVKYLDIDNSPSIKYIANSTDGLPLTTFRKLESLFLENLIKLEKICHGLIAPECFSKLKVMRVKSCDRLKYLWCLSDMQRLVQLEEIEVWRCDSMQSIVTHDAGEDIVSTNNRVELPNVRHLVLRDLPNMTSFCTKADLTSENTLIQVSLPRLESLVMARLGASLDFTADSPSKVLFDLEELKVTGDAQILSRLSKLVLYHLPNLRCIWEQDVQVQGISIFQNLKELSIKETGLSFLFPMSMAKCLREIRNVRVEDCPKMKALIVDEEGRDEGTDDIIEFPLLEQLSICCCPTEKFFSYPHGKKESITTTSNSQDTYSDSFFDQKVSLPSLQELLLKSVGSFKRIWRGVLPKGSFDKLANLTFSRCSDQLDVFPSTIIGRLHNLKSLKVLKCPSLESLFDFGSLDSYTEQTIVLLPKLKEVTVASCPSLESLFSCGSLDSNMEHKIVLLPKLKDVSVSEAGRLRHIVLSDSHTVFGFPSLKIAAVHNCSELRYLFPYYTATTLDKLKLLLISNCKQMKEVVTKEEGVRSKEKVMSFPSLITLILWWCPNLGAFIRSPTSVERQLGEMIEENDESVQPLFNDMVTFPNMRGLGIKGVQCKELWNDQIPDDSFCNLKSLKLKGCDNLQRIAPSHMWKRLQRCLKTLEVKSCRSIKIIYESDGTVVESGNLMRLVLCALDNLRHIWRYDSLPNIPFPSLRYVKVIRCSRLEMLFATSTVKFLEQIKELVVGSCEDMELIAGHEECEEATGTTITFSKLNTLTLWNLPKFKSFLPENYSMKFPSLNELDQSSESEDESDGESQDEKDGESEDISDREIELSEAGSCLGSSESESEKESEDEEVMGKLRTKVIEERELSELEDSVESKEIVSVGESEGNIEFYEGRPQSL